MSNTARFRRNALSLAVVAVLFGLAATDHAEAQDASRTYTAAELTSPPRVRNQNAAAAALDRALPNSNRSTGGRVQLQFVVGPDGKVEPNSIEVVVASADQFAAAARRAVQQIDFVPGELNGQAVRTVVLFPVTFAAR